MYVTMFQVQFNFLIESVHVLITSYKGKLEGSLEVNLKVHF